MIDFIIGSFSVLAFRAEKIIEELSKPRKVPASVLEHCQRVSERTKKSSVMIKNRQELLRQISKAIEKKLITSGDVDDLLKQILKSYRDARREIDVIEENFVGHLVRFNEPDRFLTNLAASLWKETNLPDTPPIVITNTTGYFSTWAEARIVFSPPSSEHNLLIFPDLYHEFGHILRQSLRIELLGVRYESELISHLIELENEVKRQSRPLDKDVIPLIIARWENSWAEEVACDTLASFILGPVYGWCNIHLCLQNSDVYHKGSSHPADAARTKHIFNVLRRCGFNSEVNKMESIWNKYLDVAEQKTSSYFQDYHPISLFTAIMEDVEEVIKENSFGNLDKSPTIAILNESWKQFIENPNIYTEWEEKKVFVLKRNFNT